MIAPLKAYFLGLIRLSLILAGSKSGVTTEILPGAERLNNPETARSIQPAGRRLSPDARPNESGTQGQSSNETKFSDRRRDGAVLRNSMLNFSCGDFLAGRRFAGARG